MRWEGDVVGRIGAHCYDCHIMNALLVLHDPVSVKATPGPVRAWHRAIAGEIPTHVQVVLDGQVVLAEHRRSINPTERVYQHCATDCGVVPTKTHHLHPGIGRDGAVVVEALNLDDTH